MKTISLAKTLALAVGCGGLLLINGPTKAATTTLPPNAANLEAYTGNTFALVPTADPNVLGHPVDGVAHVSVLGNCHFHGEGEVHLPTSPDEPIVIVSTNPWSFTSSDGKNSLKFDVRGIATFEPANPNFVNITYQATIVGGSGAFARATGRATLEVTARFTAPLSGFGTWTMKGHVITPPN